MWYYFIEVFADGVRALITFILDYWALVMLVLMSILGIITIAYHDLHPVHHI
jgi:hypothetical protein